MQIQDLRFAWPGQPPLFGGLSFTVPPGVTWLGGDEGTGKTTLLRLMAGDIKAHSGTLRAGGSVFWVNPRADGCDALTPGQCFDRVAQQHPALDRAMLADLVHALDLTQHASKRLDMLSTGSRRKVWLAAAFASGATLTLLDQPFAALDKTSIGLVAGLLQEAATHPRTAWVVADYVGPVGVTLAAKVSLDAPG